MDSYGLYLNGEWVESEQKLVVTDKGNGKTFAEVSTVDHMGVDKAIQDAEAVRLEWAATPGISRGDLLLNLAKELSDRADEMAHTITLENGKPLPQSKVEPFKESRCWWIPPPTFSNSSYCSPTSQVQNPNIESSWLVRRPISTQSFARLTSDSPRAICVICQQ